MPEILKAIIASCKTVGLDWALVGGMALPAYGVTRTTLDLDVAISFNSSTEISDFLSELQQHKVQTLQNPQLEHLVFVIFSIELKDEAGIWLAPCDAFGWDDEIINRIQPVEGDPNLRVLSPEDFILTKLARDDRSYIDIQDVLQILLAQQLSIDWSYLLTRASQQGIKSDLQEILQLIIQQNPDYPLPSQFVK
ncbi:MAG: DUF6036 family nucleotidyltransferase [Candidatus Heimdallarchaeota archaeon]